MKKIGKDDVETKAYIQVIVDLFQMKEVHKEYFLYKVSREPMEEHKKVCCPVSRLSNLATYIHGSFLMSPSKAGWSAQKINTPSESRQNLSNVT